MVVPLLLAVVVAGTPAAERPAAKPMEMAADVKALVERMQAFYEKTQDFTARFEQQYSYAGFNRKQSSTGEVVFKKPGYMRWDYRTPAEKTFVLAQDRALALDPAALTLTKTAIASNQLSASVTFLFGKGKLADEFSIRFASCESCRGRLLELTPLKPDPRFQRIELEVDPKTAQVLVSTVIDPDGSKNRITFLDLKTNTGVTEERFKLKPPPNTQIVDLSAARAP